MQKLIQNIDVVQINIVSGTDEYFLPKNVDWAGRVIDRIAIVAPTASITSPVDGTTHVLTRSEIQDLYLDIYNSDEQQIATGICFENLLHTNNHPWLPGQQLSLNLSRLYFTTAPAVSGCILVYVYYGTVEDLSDEPLKKNLTVRFPLGAGQMITFQELINSYVHVNGHAVKGISVWNAEQSPVYLTLRDHALSYILRDVYSGLLRPQTFKFTAEATQAVSARLNSIDIDFDYSYIRNAMSSPSIQTITFEY